MPKSRVAWAIGFTVATLLSIAGPAIYFNRATPPILGMPPLFFWFLIVPILTSLVLWAVYVADRGSEVYSDDVEVKK
jgi:hypothetical protein